MDLEREHEEEEEDEQENSAKRDSAAGGVDITSGKGMPLRRPGQFEHNSIPHWLLSNKVRLKT